MADHEVVQADREYRIATTHAALLIVVKARNTGHENLVDLVLSGATQDDGLPCDRFEAGVPRVLVRHRYETGLGAGDGVTGLGVGGVGEDDAFAAAHAKARVAEPSHVHRRDQNTRNRPKAPGVPQPERARATVGGAW